MRFEAEMKLNYRQLLALYTLSEKLFRRKQMLIYRVIFLAAGVWRTWTVCEDDFESAAKNSGFKGAELTGRATDVFVGGVATMRDGVVC